MGGRPECRWLHGLAPSRLRIVRHHNVRAIYSTSPVPTAHLIARVLKWMTDLPWVADFRDLWTEDYRYCRMEADHMGTAEEDEGRCGGCRHQASARHA